MEILNRFGRGLLTGGLLGVAAAGTLMMVGRRRRMMRAEMMASRMLRHRARRTIRAVKDNAVRLGSAVRSGTLAFADRMGQRGSWGRT